MLIRCESSIADALSIHKQRINRGAGRHEQAVAVHAAKAQVGAALGQVDAACQIDLRLKSVAGRQSMEVLMTRGQASGDSESSAPPRFANAYQGLKVHAFDKRPFDAVRH